MSWTKVKLGELLENFSAKGNSVKNIEYLPFYGVSNETGITISKYAAEDKAEDYKVLEKGCFAYNPYRVNVGSIAYHDSDETGLISPAYVVFKAKEKTIVPELLLRFLKSSEGLRQIKLHARGTVRQALRFEDLCKIELNLPNYKEQLDFYSTYLITETKTDSLIREQSHQLDLLKKLRKQILQDAVQGKLVLQNPNDEPASVLLERIRAEKEKLVREKKIKKEKPLPPIKPEEIPFEIPENWVWCRLGDITYIASGSTPKQDAFINGTIPYFKMYNLRNQQIDFNYRPQYIKEEIHNGQLKRSRTQVGDVLMNIVGPPLGKLAIIPESLPQGNFNQAAVLIRPYYKREINKWLFWYLNEMSEIESIITKGVAGQDNISVTQSKHMKIAMPPLHEQHRIITKIDHLMTLCDELEQSIQQNLKYTQELLQVALKEALEPDEFK